MNQKNKDASLLGTTEKGYTRYRFLNEYFLLMVIDHLDNPTARDLAYFPAHIARYKESGMIITNQITRQGFIDNWLARLKTHQLVTSTGNEDGANEYSLSVEGKRILDHEECDYNDQKRCKICGKKPTWDVPLERFEHLLEHPDDDPIFENEIEKLNEVLETEFNPKQMISDSDDLSLIVPSFYKDEFDDFIENLDLTRVNLNNSTINKHICKHLESLRERGELAYHPLYHHHHKAGPYTLPDINIKMRDGEVREIELAKSRVKRWVGFR